MSKLACRRKCNRNLMFDVFFLFRDHNSHTASLDRDKLHILNANFEGLQVVCAFVFRVSD